MKNTDNKFKIPEVLFFTIAFVWLFIIIIQFFKFHNINLDIIIYIFEISGNFSLIKFSKLLINYIFSTILAAGIVLGAYYIGTIIIKTIKIETKTFLEKFNFSMGLGIGGIITLTFFMGITGLLYNPIFYLLWLTMAALGGKKIYIDFKNNKVNLKNNVKGIPVKITLVLLVLLIIFNYIMSFTPEIFYDSLVYHLGAPKLYKLNHKIIATPFDHHAHYPLNMSMLYLFGIMLKGAVVAKLMNFCIGLLSVVNIYYFCKTHFKSAAAGLYGGLAFYSIPILMLKFWVTNSDVGLTYFAGLSLFALINGISDKSKPNKDKWIILSGVFGGLILGTKYTGVFFIPGLLAILLLFAFKNIGKWSVVVLLLFSPWLVRNFISTGNPVYPFLSGVIKPKSAFKIKAEGKGGYKKGFFNNPFSGGKGIKDAKNYILFPWEVSIKGGGGKPYQSIGYYMIGAVFIGIIPLILLMKLGDKKIFSALFIFLLISYLSWSLFAKSLRYYAPAFSALVVLTGYIINKIKRKNNFMGTILWIGFVILIMGNILYALQVAHYTYRPLSLITGAISREEFLSKSRNGYPSPSYSAYKYINQETPSNAKILLFGEAKTLYINRNFIKGAAKSATPIIEFLRQTKTSQEFYEFLQKKEVTHILVNIKEALRTASYGTLYFKKDDFKILNEFWESHVKKIFQDGGLYIYKFIPKDTTGEAPENTVQKTFELYHLRKIKKLIKQKNFNEAETNLNELLEILPGYDYGYYLKSVVYYYQQKFSLAEKSIKKAITLNSKKDYVTLLNQINKQQLSGRNP